MRETEVTVARPHSHCETRMARKTMSFTSGLTWLSIAQKKTFQPCAAAAIMPSVVVPSAFATEDGIISTKEHSMM